MATLEERAEVPSNNGSSAATNSPPATTEETSKSEDMKCSICLEDYYRTPRSLPCGHTFCEVCLQAYITDKEEKGELKDNVFECAVCRQHTSPPCKDGPVLKWASQFPSLDIQTEEERETPAKQVEKPLGEKTTKNCDSCAMDEVVENAVKFCANCAEHLCKDCVTYHKKFKATKAHTLLELDEARVQKNIQDTCKVHEGKCLEYYCRDDEKLCCSVCVIKNHSRCQSVREIEEMSSQAKRNTETEKIKTSMGNMRIYFQKLVEEFQTNVVHLQQQVDDIPIAVQKLKQSINHKLDDLEGILVLEGKKFLDEQKKTIQNVMQLCQNKDAEINLSLASLDETDKYGTDYQYFVAVSTLRLRARENEQFAADIEKTITNVTIELKFDQSIESLKSKKKECLGQVEKTDQRINFPLWPFDGLARHCKVKQHGFVNVSLPGTKSLPKCLNGVCLKDGRIVIVGSLNFSTNLLLLDDVLSCQFYGSISMKSSRNFGLMAAAQSVILCSSDNCSTDFLQIKVGPSACLSVEESTNKEFKCVCLGIFDDKLLLLAKQNEEGIVFATSDEKGEVKRVLFTLRGEGKWLDKWLDEYVNVTLSINSNRLLQSSMKSQSLYCYSCNGKLLFTYQHQKLKDPAGVAVDKYDNIYVCGKKSHNIHQLTPGGQLINIITCKTMVRPSRIFFSRNGKEFYVLHGKEECKHQIHRFSLYV